VALARRPGGVDVRVGQIAGALHGRRRYAVAVLAGSPLHRSLAAAGLRVLPIDSGRGDPRTVWRLFRVIVREGYRERALELGRSAREMVRCRFGVETMVGDTLRLYEGWSTDRAIGPPSAGAPGEAAGNRGHEDGRQA
jgi:hypothetical protein